MSATVWPGWILTIVRGEQPGANGISMEDPQSPLYNVTNLPRAMDAWLDEHGFDDDPGLWVLVTPPGEEPNAVDAIDARRLDVIGDVDRGYPECRQPVYSYRLEHLDEVGQAGQAETKGER